MKQEKGRRLAWGRGNGGTDLERLQHSNLSVPQTGNPVPGAGDTAAGTGAAAGTSRLLYTVPEAARMLSLSRAEVYREIARGALASVRIGRCRRISQAALQAYVDRLEQGGAR